MLRALRLLVVGVAVSGCICVRGGAPGGAFGADAQPCSSDGQPAATSSTAPADPWIEGILPPETYEGTPRPGGTFVVRLQAEPPSLDRITDSDLIMVWVLSNKVYQSLARLDESKHPDYPLVPQLAESWEISPDGLTVTFHVRKGVRWHDGQPFSGQDVVATVEKIRDPTVRSMHLRNQFDDLESIKTLPGDDYTVVATYKKPYFMAFRGLATMLVYPKHVLDVAGDLLSHPIHRAPVGTGPFKFKAWETGRSISFVRNEDYWGRKAYVDQLVYRIVPDHVAAFQLLQQGEFDLYTVLQPSMWVQDMPKLGYLREHYRRIKFYDPNYSWIGWNQLRPFFADRTVRLALTYLLDREGMRRNFLLGVDRPTTCHFYAESDSCDPTLDVRPYDPQKAKRLLDQAGWIDHDGDGIRDKDGVPFRFTFLVTASSIFSGKLAPYMQGEFRKAGIDVQIRKVEWSVYVKLLREHDFDACFLAWGYNDVVADPYGVWHSSQANAGNNYISFQNAEADRLIEQARAEMDDRRRAALFQQLGRVLYQENPYTFLYTRPSLDAVGRNVRGIRPSVAWYALEDVWLDGER